MKSFASEKVSAKIFVLGKCAAKIFALGKVSVKILHQGMSMRKFSHQEMSMRNSFSALRSCLQLAITSSFHLKIAHRLKCWTPDFLRFEMIYSIHEMDSRKYSKCVQPLLSS